MSKFVDWFFNKLDKLVYGKQDYYLVARNKDAVKRVKK